MRYSSSSLCIHFRGTFSTLHELSSRYSTPPPLSSHPHNLALQIQTSHSGYAAMSRASKVYGNPPCSTRFSPTVYSAVVYGRSTVYAKKSLSSVLGFYHQRFCSIAHTRWGARYVRGGAFVLGQRTHVDMWPFLGWKRSLFWPFNDSPRSLLWRFNDSPFNTRVVPLTVSGMSLYLRAVVSIAVEFPGKTFLQHVLRKEELRRFVMTYAVRLIRKGRKLPVIDSSKE